MTIYLPNYDDKRIKFIPAKAAFVDGRVYTILMPETNRSNYYHDQQTGRPQMLAARFVSF